MSDQAELPTPLPSGNEPSGRLRARLMPLVWMLLGGLVVAGGIVLSAALPSGSADHTQHAAAGGEDQLWTCGMHPEVIQSEPGICPICHMDLTPLDASGAAASQGAHTEHAGQLWTCPMHPDILEPAPGTCPICGMDLVPAAPAAADGPPEVGVEVTIDPVVVQNMNVRVQAVERRDLSRRLRTVGALDYDQERIVSVTTRFAGFVEKVYVNYVGQSVRRGEPLFEVYSPELVQTQQELLSAIQYTRRLAGADAETRRRAEELVAAARQRLGYWDISSEQVAAIETGGTVLRTLRVVSPTDGIVEQRMSGLEGMAIRPGMEAMRLVDLSSLWLKVEIYEDQLPMIGVGSTAEVTFASFPGEPFTGRVRFIEPAVSPTTRTAVFTLAVPNRDGRLRVGMYATVVFRPTAARDAIVIPAQAVIRSGVRDVAVVSLGDGRFAPREVTLGPQSDGLVQVLDGLEDGEQVVTSAQFLIDSESNLRAAVAKMIAAKTGHGH